MATPRKTPAKKTPAKRAPAKKPAAETAAPAEQVSGETTEEVKAQEAPPSPDARQPTEPDAGKNAAAGAGKDTVKPELKTPEKPKVTSSAPLDPNDDEEGEIEIDGVWVTSKPKSFRRAGYRFTQEGFGIALHALKEGELEMLESEPNLIVEHVTFTDVPLTKPKAD